MESVKNNYELSEIVINNSVSKNWKDAINEWYISNMNYVDDDETCICGKEGIKYCYEIKNIKNGNILYPIGSSCIKKFEREDLVLESEAYKVMYKIYKYYNSKGYKNYSMHAKNSSNENIFNRKIIEYFYDKEVFKSNKFSEEETYSFLIDMFNKKSDLSEKQRKKVFANIKYNIIPYVNKIMKCNN